jgi:hypothetical protein
MLRMQEIVFRGFKFQTFSGGECPQTPVGLDPIVLEILA